MVGKQSKHSRNYRQINRYNRMANLASPRSSQHTTSLSMQSRRRDMPACRRIPLGPKNQLLVELGTWVAPAATAGSGAQASWGPYPVYGDSATTFGA